MESVSDSFTDATDLLRESSKREMLSDLIAMNMMRTDVILRWLGEPNYCPLVQPPIRFWVRVRVIGGRTNGQFVRLIRGQTNAKLPLLNTETDRHRRQRVVQICFKM